MGKLHYGIHRGTLMSRDVCDTIDIESEEAAKEKIKELEKNYYKHGCLIWFANYRETPGCDPIKIHNGCIYH